jgi:sugar phosphate isomerase/epimerase
MKPAFSTVACPDWTLEKVVEAAEKIGALGIEFRTFGHGSTQSACDPALTAPEKVRALLNRAGVSPCCLATGIRFDEPIFPPVLGRAFSDTERSVREAKSMIDLARELECPYVRVFAFEFHGDENRRNATARILDRLTKALDHCRNTGVQLVIENGGSFPTATLLADLIDQAESPLLKAAYSPAVALQAGESFANGINVLSDRLVSIKLKDFKDGRPCALGEGQQPVAEVLDTAARAGFDGWLVYEYDRAWLDGRVPDKASKPGRPLRSAPLPDPEVVLQTSMRFIYERLGRSQSGRTDATPRPLSRV